MPKKKKEVASENKTTCESCPRKCGPGHSHPVGGGIYGLGLLGAALYYFQHMPPRADILYTVFKVIFWPGFLVYSLLERNLF